MILNFLQRSSDLMHVLFVSQQCVLRDPDRFPSRTVGFRKIFLQKWMWLFGLPAGELLAVLPTLEHRQNMHRRVTCLVGNALGIHGGNESFDADARKNIAIDVKDISVLSIAGAR